MKKLIGLTKEELIAELAGAGLKPFRANQIWHHLYGRGVVDFAKMTDLAKETQEALAAQYNLARPEITHDKTSVDGTRKWLVKFEDGNEVEVVYIPEENRGTLCISSQVGCTLACKFCHTGTQTWVRNLTVEEIVGQVLMAKDCLNDWNTAKNALPKLTNVVFMGMGEPFYNYDNVKKTVEILLDQKGLSLAARRVTVSTSGLVPEILKAAVELKTILAISLHSANDAVRTKIMAINKQYPLDDLMKSCQFYNQENKSQKITFEYVMLDGVNDSDEQAKELAQMILKYDIAAKVNLIPFNPWMSCGFEKSSGNRIHAFQDILKKQGVFATIRKTRGEDVMAACGQLKSESKRLKKTRP